MKQLPFSSWKANPTKGNIIAFQKVHNKCVSTLSRARKQHLANFKNELSNLHPPPRKQIRPKATSDHSTKPATNVCPLSGEPENIICPNSRMNFQTCLPPLKPGGSLLRLSVVYALPPSQPSLQIAPQPTQLVRRMNASIVCLLPNLVSQIPHSQYPFFPVMSNCSWTVFWT